MTRRASIFAAGFSCLIAAPALADGWECTMTLECLDTEACAQTDYTFWLGPLQQNYLFSDIAGERPMREVEVLDEPDQRAFISQVQNTLVGLVSIYPDGRAHYSMHSSDFAARYSGTCEAQS